MRLLAPDEHAIGRPSPADRGPAQRRVDIPAQALSQAILVSSDSIA